MINGRITKILFISFIFAVVSVGCIVTTLDDDLEVSAAPGDHDATVNITGNGRVETIEGEVADGSIVLITSAGKQFKLFPGSGYYLKDITGVVIPNIKFIRDSDTFFLDALTGDIALTFVFEKLYFIVDVTKSDNGTISNDSLGIVGDGPTAQLEWNSSHTFRFTPSAGYYISKIIVDGSSVGSPSAYTFSNIQDNHTLSVLFERIVYRISAFTDGKGFIIPSGSEIVTHAGTSSSENFIEVPEGNSARLEFVPRDGFRIDEVRINGVLNRTAADNGYYYINAIGGDVIIEVSYVKEDSITTATYILIAACIAAMIALIFGVRTMLNVRKR